MDEPRPSRRQPSADFAPVPVGSRGGASRPRWLAAAWIVLLGGAIALASVGRPSAPAAPGIGTPTATAGPGRSPVVPVAVTAVHGPPAAAARPLAIHVESTAGGLVVTGTVLIRSVASVAVRVVGADGAAVVVGSLPTGDLDGGIRPNAQPTFTALVGLPEAAIGEPGLLVEVEADDSLGAAVGSVSEWLGFPQRRCGPSQDCP